MSEFHLDTPENNLLDRPVASLLRLDWEKAIYLAFIIIAIVSRFYGLGERVVSHDESLHTQYSYQYYNGDGYSHTPLMHGPFLFHATAASFWLFGDSDFSSRIPVAIIGIILVGMPFLLRDWMGRKGALFASFFLLVSPYIVYYTRYIRHDLYVIVWAMIVFISTLYYMRDRQDKYLWWFAGGLALMFATKEVSFIYVATFGSFLVIRLLARLIHEGWTKHEWQVLKIPIAIIAIGMVLLGGSFLAARSLEEPHTESTAAEVNEPVAIDPDGAMLAEGALAESTTALTLAHVGRVTGLIIVGVALFLAVRAMLPRLKVYAEYDLIIIYAALILPTTAAFLATLAGVNPRSFNLQGCEVPVVEGQNALGAFFARIGQSSCWSAFFGSDIVTTSIFMIFLLVAGLWLGYWWGGKRFIAPAIVFHVIFALLYTSLFTNMSGWYSGMVDSLGYWLEQHDVQRGSQPAFYYLFVTPFYEFLPILFSLLGIRYWLSARNASRSVGHWVGVLIAAYWTMSFVNWLVNRRAGGAGFTTSENALVFAFIIVAVLLRAYLLLRNPADSAIRLLAGITTPIAIFALLAALANLPIDGMALDPATGIESLSEKSPWIGRGAALLVLFLGSVYYLFVVRPSVKAAARTGEETASWRMRFDAAEWTGFIPHVTWWMLFTWVGYSIAGEKMPWLSTHMVIPMALIAGWYLGELVKNVSWGEFTERRNLLQLVLATAIIIVGFLTIKGILVDVQIGSNLLGDLTNMGALFGRIFTLAILVYAYQRHTSANQLTKTNDRRSWLLASFAILSLLTIRFTYMANYVNADSSSEFLVYAHGSPATKQQVMEQLDEISTRLEGDKSVRVSFDNKSSWPYYWYLREYENQHFFGENPDASIADSPVIIAGSTNWDSVETIIRDDYEATTYSYIWWPMEEYRQFSWGALFGINGIPDQERGLGSRAVRGAMWDIFFYRDYEQYGDVFGGNYDAGQWPLRADLKMYIRRDVLGKLWDSGLTASNYQPPVDPYALGEVTPSADLSFGSLGAGPGQLDRPRNAAVAPDGRLYVADTGNHRIQVFNPDGTFAFGFGEFGSEDGQLNEPWGIAIGDEFVYVADTWNGRIQTFTLDGEVVSSFGRFDTRIEGQESPLAFYGPRSIALYNDQLFIMDTGNHRIQVVDTDGNYVSQVGTNGFDLGQFNEPVGLTIGDDGTVYVAEAWSERIQVLGNDLTPFNEWQIEAWDGVSLDNKPYLTIDGNGRIYATDPEGQQVLIFNVIGEYLGRFGRFGTDNSQFILPTGITTDAQNNVYVVDTNNNRVQKFAPVNLQAPTE